MRRRTRGRIHDTIRDFSLSANPRSCVFTATVHQTNKIAGGTGQFAAAAGRFTATVTGRGVLLRNRDGSCDSSRDPLHEVDHDHGNRHAVVLTCAAQSRTRRLRDPAPVNTQPARRTDAGRVTPRGACAVRG
jgi:hypothetical protein